MHTTSSKPFFTIQTYEDRNNAINRELNQKVSERLSAPTSLLPTQWEAVPQDKPSSIITTTNNNNNNASAKIPPATPIRTSASSGSCNNNGLKTDNIVGDNRSGVAISTSTTSAAVTAPPPPPFPIRDSPRPIATTPAAHIPHKINPCTIQHPTTNGFHATNGTTSNNGVFRSKAKAPPPPVPIKTSVLSHLQPPPCPSPDYDTLSLSAHNATLNRNGKLGTTTSQQQQQKGMRNDSVEMESLDSFKLNKPYDATPRPPSNYFNKIKQDAIAQNGNAHIISNGIQEQRKPRPVSVTIGEYPSGMTRKTPGKLDFLQQRDDVDGKRNGNTQFVNELAMTLSRSDLRKRTESMANSN